MKIINFLIITFLLISCNAKQDNLPTIVLHPHEQIPGQIKQNNYKTVFLAGTIDMGSSEDWQKDVAGYFEEDTGNWILFNPRQENWDPNRENEMDYQVNWELSHLEDADFILMNFLPESKSPITLLELGLFAKTGKLHVICPENFYRYDNVRITCQRYGVPIYPSVLDAVKAICQ